VDIAAALTALRTLPPKAALAREMHRLHRDALVGSLTIAGNPLAPPEIDRLIESGRTSGPHPLEAYLTARHLAQATAWLTSQRLILPEDPRPRLSIDDIRRLHHLVATHEPEAQPGAWRRSVHRDTSGIVSPAPWIVPFEMAALVELLRRAPRLHAVPALITGLLVRFARIRPFSAANGRTARLTATLLLHRLDLPPLAIAPRSAANYRDALARGLRGEREPLERLVTQALDDAAGRLLAVGGDDPLLPLRTLAREDYAALIKAAQRGRLRTIERDGRVFSTQRWVERYRNREPQV
jgi:Fic family protein